MNLATRHLYLVRHGAADAFGAMTDVGRQQSQLVGSRLARLPIDAVWHSPVPRAIDSAQIIGERLTNVPVAEAPELVDHVPHVPHVPPPAWRGFFDGYDAEEAKAGRKLADALTERFAQCSDTETHEVLVTHAYQIAWMVRHALGSPPDRWLGMSCGNASLTAIDFHEDSTPALILYNDMGHLPPELRWTGFGHHVWP
jgi:serine/threonine-protein phosphatase PGAM5